MAADVDTMIEALRRGLSTPPTSAARPELRTRAEPLHPRPPRRPSRPPVHVPQRELAPAARACAPRTTRPRTAARSPSTTSSSPWASTGCSPTTPTRRSRLGAIDAEPPAGTTDRRRRPASSSSSSAPTSSPATRAACARPVRAAAAAARRWASGSARAAISS